MLKGKLVVLTKTKDKVFEGNHPNGINVGNSEIHGFAKNEPVVGEQFYLYDSYGRVISWTSTVESFDDKEIHTKNSVYSIDTIEGGTITVEEYDIKRV